MYLHYRAGWSVRQLSTGGTGMLNFAANRGSVRRLQVPTPDMYEAHSSKNHTVQGKTPQNALIKGFQCLLRRRILLNLYLYATKSVKSKCPCEPLWSLWSAGPPEKSGKVYKHKLVTWPNGKALDYESRDCRFDPCRDLLPLSLAPSEGVKNLLREPWQISERGYH